MALTWACPNVVGTTEGATNANKTDNRDQRATRTAVPTEKAHGRCALGRLAASRTQRPRAEEYSMQRSLMTRARTKETSGML